MPFLHNQEFRQSWHTFAIHIIPEDTFFTNAECIFFFRIHDHCQTPACIAVRSRHKNSKSFHLSQTLPDLHRRLFLLCLHHLLLLYHFSDHNVRIFSCHQILYQCIINTIHGRSCLQELGHIFSYQSLADLLSFGMLSPFKLPIIL